MNRERLYLKMEQENIDYLVLSRIDNVDYLTGAAQPAYFGAYVDNAEYMPFGYAVVSLADRKVYLVASSMVKFAFSNNIHADETIFFDQFSYVKDIYGAKAALDALSMVIPKNCAGKRFGVESDSMPAAVYHMLQERQAQLVDATDLMIYCRKVKSPDEIEIIKRTCAIEDAGQNRLLKYAAEFNGETDFEMWSGILLEMNKVAGKALEISGELATGLAAGGTAYPSGPVGRQVQAGEMGRMDISIRPFGYWCDCTNTVVFGNKFTDRQKFLFSLVQEAYYAAEAVMRPGNDLYDVHKACLDVYRKYGFDSDLYSGHQLGCGVNERPRLLNYTHAEIESGMVLCLEPQMYIPGDTPLGVRLEHVVLVTDDGPEDLNKFPWGYMAT